MAIRFHLWVQRLFRAKLRCPCCGIPFSAWFTWDTCGTRFCFPCWQGPRRTGRIITEFGEEAPDAR
jgi:hypothetical protein